MAGIDEERFVQLCKAVWAEMNSGDELERMNGKRLEDRMREIARHEAEEAIRYHTSSSYHDDDGGDC